MHNILNITMAKYIKIFFFIKVVGHQTKSDDSFVYCLISPHPMKLMTNSLFSSMKTDADEELSLLLHITEHFLA